VLFAAKKCWLAMAARLPIEIVHTLARQRGAGDADLLVLTRELDAHPGERISHLPISQRLAEAWVTLTGAPFRPHQALALSALRRAEPFALTGDRRAARLTIHLLLHDVLLSERGSCALLLLPDDAAAAPHLEDLRYLGQTLGLPLRAVHLSEGTPARDAARAQVVLATPTTLHRRLLRHHDRAWQTFWERLNIVALIDCDHYTGVAAAHLAGLLLRAMRLAARREMPLAATLGAIPRPEAALARLSGTPWRVVPVRDMPYPATMLAVWQAGHRRLNDAAALALELAREGYQAQIVCGPLDMPLLRPLLDEDDPQISLGTTPLAAQVHIFAGYPASPLDLRQSLHSSALLTLLLLGTQPIERVLARRPDSLLDDPPPTWIPAPANAYIEAQHVLCAASEYPLSLAEVEAWQAGPLIARLQRHSQLVRLPSEHAAWQPHPQAGDPYEGFAMQTVGGAPFALTDEQQRLLHTSDPAALDRWAFVGAALPPVRGGYRVVARDDDAGTLTLRAEHPPRRTFPLRRCTISLREPAPQPGYMLRGHGVGLGRVLAEEEIYAYRETQPDHTPAEHPLDPPLSSGWTAPALWIDLPRLPGAPAGQLIGWSLALALPLCVLSGPADSVPVYDAEQGRLYLIDAHPGGSGLAAWLYENLETVLPLAYDLALDCKNDALLEPAARIDMDWLLSLLGGAVSLPDPPRRLAARPAPPESAPKPAPPPPPEPAPEPVASAPPPAPEPAAAEDKPRRSRRSKPKPAAEDKPRRERSSKPKPAAEDKPRRSTRSTRSKASDAPPPEPPAPAPAPEAEYTPPDADAILARLQRLRAHSEAAAPSPKKRPTTSSSRATPRFRAGDRVICRPYGEGVVYDSRIEQEHELLRVEFPEHGRLEIDPAVSLVRRIKEAPAPDDEQ
jgi:outer membrane biosynthesis protein TonB